MVKVVKSGNFLTMLDEINDPDIYILIREKIKIFINKPNDTRLRNHLLKKRMKGKFAFSVIKDIRIVYEWLGKNKVRFLAIGGHNKVYNS